MVTDSNYMAISADKLEDIVRPELREKNLKQKRKTAWLGTSGAATPTGSSNLHVREAG